MVLMPPPHGFEKDVHEPTNDYRIKERIRIALFGSFYKGFFMLNQLLYGQISNIVTVVGVATDDPTQSYTSPKKRVWQYPHTKYEVQMVKELAKENEIDTYVGRIKT